MTTDENLTLLQGRAVQRYGNALFRHRAAKKLIEHYHDLIQAAATRSIETWLKDRGNVIGDLPTNQQIEQAQRDMDAAAQEINAAIEDMRAASVPHSIWTGPDSD